jgi:hypothetical protein
MGDFQLHHFSLPSPLGVQPTMTLRPTGLFPLQAHRRLGAGPLACSAAPSRPWRQDSAVPLRLQWSSPCKRQSTLGKPVTTETIATTTTTTSQLAPRLAPTFVQDPSHAADQRSLSSESGEPQHDPQGPQSTELGEMTDWGLPQDDGPQVGDPYPQIT